MKKFLFVILLSVAASAVTVSVQGGLPSEDVDPPYEGYARYLPAVYNCDCVVDGCQNCACNC